MNVTDIDKLIRKYRTKPIARPEDFTHPLDFCKSDIERILPHRDPFLLIDRLQGVDLEAGRILGSRHLDENDPIFGGHFPGTPVYPGSLQLEMAGQLGLCLFHFLRRGEAVIDEDTRPVAVRVSRVLGAYFTSAVLPGRAIHCIAQQIEWDEFVASVLLQVLSEDGVHSVSAVRVFFPDDTE